MGRPLLGDRPTTGAERKRKWRERERQKQILKLGFDPLTVNAFDVLMARAIPAFETKALTLEPVMDVPSPEAAERLRLAEARLLAKLDE
jgi:hypothetical protein